MRGRGSYRKRHQRKTLTINIPIPGLSVNKIYSGRKTRSWHYKKYRKQIFNFLEDYDPNLFCLKGNLHLSIEVGFSSKLSDLSNIIKALEDCLAEKFKFNDRQISDISMKKFLVNKGDEYTKVFLRKSKRNIDTRNKNSGRHK